jgi:hypothetical protein
MACPQQVAEVRDGRDGRGGRGVRDERGGRGGRDGRGVRDGRDERDERVVGASAALGGSLEHDLAAYPHRAHQWKSARGLQRLTVEAVCVVIHCSGETAWSVTVATADDACGGDGARGGAGSLAEVAVERVVAYAGDGGQCGGGGEAVAGRGTHEVVRRS